MFENKDKQPAYGMLAFSRISGGNPNLFGSSIRHTQKIQLTLKEGHVTRELNNDWYAGDKTLFEVEMSYTQFAELISAMNVGDGVPVTIRYTENKGRVDGIQIVNKRTQFLDEFKNQNEQSVDQINKMIKQLQTIFAEKRPLKAKEKTEILSALAVLSNTINSHNIFTLSQFDEAMEKIATEAKGEVEAFIQNKMNSLALVSMKETNALNLKNQNPLLPDDNK